MRRGDACRVFMAEYKSGKIYWFHFFVIAGNTVLTGTHFFTIQVNDFRYTTIL